ncbi:MAG TPA: AI-2E family transporter [Gemmatimonadaceae bacterium]|jgi:predicted PurR-regulated permease PerM|nr:AI-2E family transporter [Gemmatimonadaceae bacterium]HPV75449.1 AI-2E family transporter [Gemmatimonadaceae bacterium]
MNRSSSITDTLEWVIRRSGLPLPPPVFPGGSQYREGLELPASLGESDSARTDGMALRLSVMVLAALAVLYTLYIARAVVLPVVIAILLSFLLRGPVRVLKRWHIPEQVGAALVVLSGTLVLASAIMLLAGPARSWVERAPGALSTVERKMRSVAIPLLKWEATAKRVQALASGGDNRTPARTIVETSRPGMVRRVFGGVANALIAALSVIFLSYFLLASGDLFLRKLMRVLPYGAETSGVPQRVSDQVESAVSTYLRTTVLINAGLGLLTWGVLSLLGMPNAGLWGAVAGCLNFVPYLGALLTMGVLGVAAIAVFDTIGEALLIPGAFLVLNLIESNGVTPLLMGRQFPLNSVALFVGVLFWGFVWGVAGAMLAVPIMVTLKIVCDSVPALQPVGEFLGQ